VRCEKAVEKQEGRLCCNNAGVLFFAKEPQRFIPWSVYTVALFKDEAGVDIIDRKEIEGSLFEIVEEVMKFVRLYAKVAYRFTGRPRRENVYEYPFDAIRKRSSTRLRINIILNTATTTLVSFV